MKLMSTLVLGGTIGITAFGAGTAITQARPLARFSYENSSGGAYPPEGVQPGLFQADGRACVKQCPDDLLPCDPPSFKQADGRCSYGNR